MSKRVFGCPPVGSKPTVEWTAAVEAELRNLRAFTRRWCEEHLTPLKSVMKFEQWLDSTDYPEWRKSELREVQESQRGRPPHGKVCHTVKQFVKHESYPEYKHARTINSRADAVKVWLGPIFKSIEQQLYDRIDDIRFIKHVPVGDRPVLINALAKLGHYYSTDFTAYEHHFTKLVMESCEFQLYEYMVAHLIGEGQMRKLERTLSGVNRMRSRTGVTAKCTARRMSGEMCTSLGNGFTNMMLALYIVHKKQGTVIGFVEGDDGLFSSTVELTSFDYAQLGFEIKMEEVAKPGEASFCGLLCSESGQVVRDPREFLGKFGWTHDTAASPKVQRELLLAKCLSTLCECGDCPIIGVLAREGRKKCGWFTKPRFVYDGYHKALDVPFYDRGFKPTDSTRAFFAAQFGVDVPTQLKVEELIRSDHLDRIPDLLPPPRDQLHYYVHYVT